MIQAKLLTKALLLGLLDKTKSVLGKQLLKDWVSRPTIDENIIKYRHSMIDLFLSSNATKEKIVEIRSFLKHIKNINRLLFKVRELKATFTDWQYILKVF